jgi:alpha/beta hydrolase fold
MSDLRQLLDLAAGPPPGPVPIEGIRRRGTRVVMRRRAVGLLAVAALAVAAAVTVPRLAAAPVTPAPAGPSVTSGEVDALFDVGGYKLRLLCKGTGSPTLVYFHGLGGGSAGSTEVGVLATPLAERYRFCSYDRVNTGASGTEQAMHTGADSVRDLHTLLAAADVRGPYLLVGFGWGGVLASMYAGTHPDDVMGILLLNSALPTDDEIEALMPPAELAQLKTEWNAVEREDLYLTLAEAKPLMKSVPDVPVTFMVGKRPVFDREVDKQMQAVREIKWVEFVEQFRQGKLVRVDSSHEFDVERPELVVAEVQRIVAAP